MTWPDRVQQIVNQLALGVEHDAPDEQRRAITQKIAEQCRFELGPNWGWKRADPGRPLSTDVFCTKEPFIGWDWSIPSGIASFPSSIDLTGQVFVTVQPVNHLDIPDTVPTRPTPGTPDLEARLKAIEAELALVRLSLAKLHETPAPVMPAPVIVFPEYTGKLFGYTITLRPKGL